MPDDATALAPYGRRMGWLLRFLPPLAVAAVVTLVPAIAHASCRPVARASSGTVISGVVPTVKCFERTLEQDFRRHYARFQSDEAEATLQTQLGISNIENPVKAPTHGGTCNSDDYNRSYSHRKARVVLDSLVPTAREFLDKARDDLQDMSEAAAFAASNHQVLSSLADEWVALHREVDSLYTANNRIETGAKQLDALNCEDALTSAEVAQQTKDTATRLGEKARRAIDKLLSGFDHEPCKDFSSESSPMSAGQISRAAGGGGTQTGRAGRLDILAPRRISGQRGTRLPLTLKARAPGAFRIDLTRGKTEATGVNGLIRRGAASLRIVLPHAAARGPAKLRIVFSSSHRAVATKTITIRIV